MPLVKVMGNDVLPEYHLIACDSHCNERINPDGSLESEKIFASLTAGVTDVFIFSHGWMGDVPAAIKQYQAWISAMLKCPADIAAMRSLRPGFNPLMIGLHWPSLPYGDESLDLAGDVAFDLGGAEESPVDAAIRQFANRIADTPAAFDALRIIFAAALEDVAPSRMPAEVAEAYRSLDRESGMGSAGPAGDPASDREPFDPEALYRAAEDEAVDFGGGGLGGLLQPLRVLSYWKMKDRARQFGATMAGSLLARLQTALPEAKFHLMGHSFGCVVMSSIVAGVDGNGPIVRPVDSLALVQGALSLWSYCSSIPSAPDKPGYFHGIIKNGRVNGPIITTQSEHDYAVGRMYPLASGVANQFEFAPSEGPRYGGVGTFGLRGPIPKLHDVEMLSCEGDYKFEPGHVYNIESSRFISKILDQSGGAHGDIDRPEVAHAVWSAAMTKGA